MRLSIIVPAYNVADYIEKCIHSLEDQDIPKEDYEIIVTNDGSPDDCQAIVERLQKEFSNIVLINQENQGVSMARNNAIAAAKGKYIMPIDPDDYVLPNTLAKELDYADLHNLDVLYLGFEVFDEKGKSIWQTNYSGLHEKIYDGVEGYFAHRGNQVKDPDRSWAILYKSEMLIKHCLQYPEGVPFLEDGCFLINTFAVAERVGFSDTIFYQRTTCEGSATVSGVFYSEMAINGFIQAALNLKSFSAKNTLTKPQQQLINHGISKYVLLSLSPSMATYKVRDYFAVVSKLSKAGLSKLDTDGLRFLYKKHIKMFNLSKAFFPIYFRLNN